MLFTQFCVNVIAVGWPNVIVNVVSHPNESCTSTEYVPAAKPVALDVVCTGNVFHV